MRFRTFPPPAPSREDLIPAVREAMDGARQARARNERFVRGEGCDFCIDGVRDDDSICTQCREPVE